MSAGRIPLLLAPALGFGVWAIGFLAIYAVQGIGCALAWDEMSLGPFSLLRTLVVAMWAVTLLGVVLATLYLSMLRRAARGANGAAAFILSVSSTCGWLAMPTVVLTFIGAAGTSACT